MSDEECPHGLGEPAWCVLCNGRDKREAARALSPAYRFRAGFDSTVDCGHAVVQGELLTRLENNRIVCEDCGR